jgi:hypothetical protein
MASAISIWTTRAQGRERAEEHDGDRAQDEEDHRELGLPGRRRPLGLRGRLELSLGETPEVLGIDVQILAHPARGQRADEDPE